MKTEIEHTQHLLERSKAEVQHQFEEWWQRLVCKVSSSCLNSMATAGTEVMSCQTTPANRTAWKTPPTSTASPQSHCLPVDSSGQNTSVTDSHILGHRQSTTHSSGQDRSIAHVSGHKEPVPLAHRTPAAPQPLFSSPSHSAIPLTGDEKTDADIVAFYRASQKLAAKGEHH